MQAPASRVAILIGGGLLAALVVAGPAWAQPAPPSVAAADEAARARSALAIMEGVLERAVVMGAESLNRRVRALAPQDPPLLLAGDVDVRGFRLEDYGVFFDVEVPMLRQSVAWSLRARLDQGGVPLAVAVEQLRAYVRTASDARTRESLEQALRRLELQVGPGTVRTVAADRSPEAPGDAAAWLSDPNAAYTAAVKAALIDAMLQHSQALGLAPEDWLTIAARDNESRHRPTPGEAHSTVTLRIKGADLAALRAGRLTIEEARRRVDIREQ